jgi:PAS domain S-box-containing protein
MVRVTEQAAFFVTSSDDEFAEIVTEKDITRGTFAVFALGQIGVLKLYAPNREEPFARAELGQLANVIDKFSTSLEGCLAHRRVIEEMSEREWVQQELARERNLLQALLDNAPDWIFFKDAQSRIIKSNKTHAQVLGIDDPQEAIGKTDFDFFPPEDAERFYQEEQGFLQAGQPIIGRVGPTPAPDGEILWRSETKVPLEDEAGQIIGLIGISRDVTELKRAEEMLQMRVKELDCLNEVGREIEESPEIPELLEWVTERIPPAMRYPELCQVAIEYDDQVYGVPEAIDLPTQMAHGLYIGGKLLGRIYIAYTDQQDFLDEESALLGGIATRLSSYIENQRLIAELEQRAVELEAATSFLDSIVENIPNMILVKDARELRFVRFNQAGEELIGVNRKDLIGKNDYDFFPQEEADFFTAKDREVLAGGKLVDIPEEPIDTLHQGTRLLHTIKVPILGRDGQPQYLLGISEDITERKQAEAERERLLAEVEATYRQYVQQEWQQFLGEQHDGHWQIELQQPGLAAEPGDNGNHKTTIEAPIALRGQQIGSLRLEDLDPTRRWTAEEQALVEAVSQQLAQTVENLRLFDETQQRAGREHLTRQITDKMRAAPDVDSVIETGLSELAKALGVSRTYVKLSPKADSSKIEAVRDELKHNGFKAISATASASQREEADNPDQVEE